MERVSAACVFRMRAPHCGGDELIRPAPSAMAEIFSGIKAGMFCHAHFA
jgi:hypothetical protein